MFTTLHELAKKAPLMITVAAEGDGQLRVNVTPTPTDTKAKHNLPQPLSLLATPTEFDADFIAALSTWQAPKRSLIQQAQDAVSPPAAAAGALALPAPKAEAKSDSKPEKPGRKPRGGKGGEEDKKLDATPGAAAAAGEAAAAADQVMADTANVDGGDEPNASASTTADQGAAPAGDVAVGDKAAGDMPVSTSQAGVDVYTRDIFAEGTSAGADAQPPVPVPAPVGQAVGNVGSMDIF